MTPMSEHPPDYVCLWCGEEMETPYVSTFSGEDWCKGCHDLFHPEDLIIPQEITEFLGRAREMQKEVDKLRNLFTRISVLVKEIKEIADEQARL